MENVNKFINAFVRIEKCLKEIINTNRYLKFYQLVEICRKKNLVVKINAKKLLDYADLRNVILHQRDDNDEILAIPTDSVVEDIEKLADLIEVGEPILNFASRPVKTVSYGDNIQKAYSIMKELGTTKIPVYEEGRFVGLITMECIADALINNQYESNIKSIVEKNCLSNKVIFFDRNRSIHDVIEMFENRIEKGNSLSAIIISKFGSKSELPLGIITVYDLPKIMAYFL